MLLLAASTGLWTCYDCQSQHPSPWESFTVQSADCKGLSSMPLIEREKKIQIDSVISANVQVHFVMGL